MSKKRSEVKMYWKKQKFGMFFLKVFVPFILAVSVTSFIISVERLDIESSTCAASI